MSKKKYSTFFLCPRCGETYEVRYGYTKAYCAECLKREKETKGKKTRKWLPKPERPQKVPVELEGTVPAGESIVGWNSGWIEVKEAIEYKGGPVKVRVMPKSRSYVPQNGQ